MFSGRECRAFPVYGATCPASGGKCRSLRRCFDGCCQGGGTRRTSVFCYRISFRSFVKEYLDSGRIGRLNFMCRGALCRNEKRRQAFPESLPRSYGRCRAPIIFIRRLAVCNFRRPGSRSEHFRNPFIPAWPPPDEYDRAGPIGRRSACTIRPARRNSGAGRWVASRSDGLPCCGRPVRFSRR